MNLYLLSQTKVRGYDTFDSAVVAAESEEQAREIHPKGEMWSPYTWDGWDTYSWPNPKDVVVEFIGTAKEGTPVGVICRSFNAG